MTKEEQYKQKYFNAHLAAFPKRTQNVLLNLKPTIVPAKPTQESAFLHGFARTGKSIAAAKYMMDWQKAQFLENKSMDALFVKVPQLLFDMRQTYSEPDPEMTEKQILHKFQTVRFLVLDDLGVEKTTEWAYQMLYLIVDYRYDNELPTIFTSNFNLFELSKKLNDDRLPTRIAHQCKETMFIFKNEPFI